MTFRGSIPHPMQLLCTLRDHCRQWPRNTRYQAGAAPYLGRTSTGWIAPACLAHSLAHLVGAGEQHRRDVEAEPWNERPVLGPDLNCPELGGTILPMVPRSVRTKGNAPSMVMAGSSRAKIIGYILKFLLDPVHDFCIRYAALLIEGRLRRQSRWRSQAWRPAAAACNRRLGRQGTPPAGHYRPGCEERRCTDAEEMPQTEARPRPKIATVELFLERQWSSVESSGGQQPIVIPKHL